MIFVCFTERYCKYPMEACFTTYYGKDSDKTVAGEGVTIDDSKDNRVKLIFDDSTERDPNAELEITLSNTRAGASVTVDIVNKKGEVVFSKDVSTK